MCNRFELPISKAMNILLVSQLETLWMRKHHLMKQGGLRDFISYIYGYSIEHCFDRVIITRSSELPIEDAFALFEEFGFECYGYGDENYEELVDDDDIYGRDYLDHPLIGDKVIKIGKWMHTLATHNVSMYCLEECENTNELRIALRDGVGVRLKEMNSIMI